MLLRQKYPRRVHIAAGNMAVDVDRSVHEDMARKVVQLIDCGIGPRVDGDAAIPDV